MADDSTYSTSNDTSSTHKRKHEDHQTPPTRSRSTGFSSPNTALPPPPPLPNQQTFPQSYNSVPPPVDGFQAAKQKAQEIAARLLAAASSDPKRPRVDNGSLLDSGDKSSFGSGSAPIPVSYGSYGGSISKKIEIPNGRVGVIIGKGGDTIKFLQLQSGAKIQVTRDMEADPNALMRPVELMGTPDQVEKAEQLINDVLSEADAGGSGTVLRRLPGDQGGSDHFVYKVPNSKVGLVIGKGGETIKNMQAQTGARIQVIPLHLPPGDTSQERSVHIDGTSEQIEAAKQLVTEVISSENRTRNNSMGGAYAQGYQARPPTNWAPSGVPSMQQASYGYMQSGAYGQSPYQTAYAGYPQASGGYPGWDQSGQQASQAYDYYSQAGSQQATNAADGVGYSYNQGTGYMQGHGYDGYGGYSQAGYGAYDQQGYGYGQDGSSYGAQADTSQALAQPPAGQQPSPSQAAYGASYQAPKGGGTGAVAGAQQSPSDGYGQGSYGQGQSGGESGSQRGGSYAQTGYGAGGYGGQSGYGPSAYGSNGSGYPQGTYGSDAAGAAPTAAARASYDSAPPAAPSQQPRSGKSSQAS